MSCHQVWFNFQLHTGNICAISAQNYLAENFQQFQFVSLLLHKKKLLKIKCICKLAAIFYITYTYEGA